MPLVPVTRAERPADCDSSSRGTRTLPALAALLLIAAQTACAGNPVTERTAVAASESRSFALYALSRGQGVPESARAVLAGAERVIEELQARGGGGGGGGAGAGPTARLGRRPRQPHRGAVRRRGAVSMGAPSTQPRMAAS